MNKKRKILITNGLTYANDSIHLGHIVGYIYADIWTRFQKMCGNTCYNICGSDAHGTPVMLSAEKQGISPDELVEKIRQEQEQDVRDFHVELDMFYTTHSPENRELAEMVYERLKTRGDIIKKTVAQAFDPVKQMFLPDRYVKGECPQCGAPGQYGDSCEKCSATYSPLDLKNPISVISGVAPIIRESEHYFFQLPHYQEKLKAWIHAGHIQEQLSNKLDEWFQQGLQSWDISRDAPYFGFEIPDAPGKYFYVWMDAPIGYISIFKHFCDQNGMDYLDFWKHNAAAEIYHVIGKDITYFHALFWPAMLMGADLKTPDSLFVHGFLTVNGEKMSKSRGTFIKARKYLDHLDPECLRYYLASKLSSRIEDVDFNLEDFRQKINADLVGKVVNIASRCAKFINQQFNHQLSDHLENESLFEEFSLASDKIATLYEQREFAHAIREIMALADKANQYIDEKKPWKLIKESGKEKEVQSICTLGLNLFRLLILYLKPILPMLTKKSEKFLTISPLNFPDAKTPLLSSTIQVFEPLMQRIEENNVKNLLI